MVGRNFILFLVGVATIVTIWNGVSRRRAIDVASGWEREQLMVYSVPVWTRSFCSFPSFAGLKSLPGSERWVFANEYWDGPFSAGVGCGAGGRIAILFGAVEEFIQSRGAGPEESKRIARSFVAALGRARSPSKAETRADGETGIVLREGDQTLWASGE